MIEQLDPATLRLWNRGSTYLGGLIWLVQWFVLPVSDETTTLLNRLLLLAVLVVVPMGLSLAAPPQVNGLAWRCYMIALLMQPFAAIAATCGFFFPIGAASALMLLPWLITCALMTLTGLLRLWERGSFQLDELAIDAGLLYIAVGAIWMLSARFGYQLMGFSATIVLLTAIHFHYAGFVAPLLTGLVGRHIAQAHPERWTLYQPIAWGVIFGVGMLAIGITVSQYAPIVELIAAILFAGSMLGCALLLLLVVMPTINGVIRQLLLQISGASLIISMLLAIGYAIGQFSGTTWISIPSMVQFHGWLNAVGFAGCGLLSWVLAKDESNTL
jgi:hypothetical protein